MSKDAQINLFEELGVEEAWKEHWKEMPEFIQEEDKPYQSILVHFRNREDLMEFAEMIKQKITYKTKSLWIPQYDREKPSNFLYINENEKNELDFNNPQKEEE